MSGFFPSSLSLWSLVPSFEKEQKQNGLTRAVFCFVEKVDRGKKESEKM